MQGQARQADEQQTGYGNHALVTVPVALIIQAMAKRIAAMMASMPHCFPYRAAIIGPEKKQAGSIFSHMPAPGGK
jgi:hypothetical protein